MKSRLVEVWERLVRAGRRLATRRSFPGWVAFGAGVVVLVALAVHQMALVGDFRIDDAYITFSFSKNLAAGHGPIFSHGVRVEGYSNFLWMLICAAGYLLAPNADPYWWARAAALVFLVGALRAVYRLVRPEAGTVAGFLAMGAVLVNTDVMRAALSGLETVPFMACIVLGWSAYLRATPPLHPKSLAWFLAAALMRIDGFVPLLIVLGFEFVSALNDRRFK
ncbi:MAG TPA: hypothetical protein VFQ61_22000, partial [Polyangiaceae bacterium]|nr:hypothetical protein [Polyangiaceae bacterium]